MDLTQTTLNNEILEVILDGKKITKSQLKEKIFESTKMKGIKIIEISPNVFKTRIQG